MPQRYFLPRGEQKVLHVSAPVKAAVGMYARAQGITQTEATWRLLNIAFIYELRMGRMKDYREPGRDEFRRLVHKVFGKKQSESMDNRVGK